MEKFIGRKKELKFLKEKYTSNSHELILIYGRRRLGKTLLIKKSISNLKNSFYFLLTKESPQINLKRFKSELSKHLNNSLLDSIESKSWEEYFSLVKDLLPSNFILILDEIPYLFSQEKSLVSQFQKIYDEYFIQNNNKLILSGSSFSIMDEIQSYSSPLYGRRSGKIHLQPFTINETKEYLSQIKDLEDVFRYQLIFGGIPYYLKQINPKKTFEENISELFLDTTSLFDDEMIFLLKEEFREVRVYLGILRSISNGYNTLGKISDNIYQEKSTISKYLITLEKLKLISSNISFFDKENSKKTKYRVEDNFMFIWFSIFEKQKQIIINDITKKKVIQDYLPKKLGYLFEKEVKRILSNYYFKIDSFFNKEGIEIDLICLNENQTIDVIECKFKKEVNEKEILEKLEKKVLFFPKSIKINKKLVISIGSKYNLKWLLNKSR